MHSALALGHPCSEVKSERALTKGTDGNTVTEGQSASGPLCEALHPDSRTSAAACELPERSWQQGAPLPPPPPPPRAGRGLLHSHQDA